MGSANLSGRKPALTPFQGVIRPSGRPRVLIIEDTPDVQRAVVRSLKGLNIDVMTANSGEEGLELLPRFLPDLVLTDVTMPGIDGYGVLETIRNTSRTAMLPVILMTARDDRSSMRRGMVMGANDYLTKPFTTEEIRECVSAQLEQRLRLSAAFTSRIEKTERELRMATHIDPDTNLPNALEYRDHLARQKKAARGVVIVLELDRFDRFRTSAGVADAPLSVQIIEVTAQRLRSLKKEQGLQVFRLGASRFAVVTPNVVDPSEADALSCRILKLLREPIDGPHGLELRVTASLGAAVWPQHDSNPVMAAEKAESACNHSKHRGGNIVSLFDPGLHNQSYNRIVLESSMHRALERDQFELHYQPQVDAQTEKLVGMEALIRWHHPELGTVSPFHFIPIAEETGLIGPIGEWVLRTACHKAAEMREVIGPVSVSVNLSALQLRQTNLVDTVRSIVEDSGVTPKGLGLELTESLMVEAGDETAASLRTLRDLGVGVSLDDFGTGYSTLKLLSSFPVTEVKIDRSFVRNLPDDHNNCSIVEAVISMAHQLGLTIVAEGVEETRQLAFLRDRGCDIIQGYYFSRPLPADKFTEWWRNFHKPE